MTRTADYKDFHYLPYIHVFGASSHLHPLIVEHVSTAIRKTLTSEYMKEQSNHNL